MSHIELNGIHQLSIHSKESYNKQDQNTKDEEVVPCKLLRFLRVTVIDFAICVHNCKKLKSCKIILKSTVFHK